MARDDILPRFTPVICGDVYRMAEEDDRVLLWLPEEFGADLLMVRGFTIYEPSQPHNGFRHPDCHWYTYRFWMGHWEVWIHESEQEARWTRLINDLEERYTG